MRLSSLLNLRRKKKRKAPEPEAPRASRGAVARALRHSAAASSYRSAADLGSRIATALSTIETAVLAIDAVNERLREASDLAESARTSEDLGRRALLAGRYDDVRAEIDATVGSATHNRVNLINGRLIGGQHAAFEIALDKEGRAGIAVSVVNLTTGAGGLELSPPRSAFAGDEEIATILSEISAAQSHLAEISLRFADHAALIADRLFRLQKLAGIRSIETDLPTGADIETPSAAADDMPLDLNDGDAEHRLHEISDRQKDYKGVE